jgi:hypothetical protein
MNEFVQKLLKTGCNLYQGFENYLRPFLKDLDPSLFQNIILGVLAIFIPFAIVFLTDILNSKKEKRSEFEKMVLSDEVLGTKKVFWLSIIGIVFFAFFSGKDISLSAKIISLIAAIFLIFLFWKPFKKILRFSEGYKPEFEIPFLKKLGLSSIFRFKNKKKSEKLFRAWNSFWSEKSDINERDFTTIFISHIDDAIKYSKFDLAIQLAQTYASNLEKRERFSVGYEILPKIFEWHESLWNQEQIWLNNFDIEKKIQSIFSQKHFPTFRDWALRLFKWKNFKRDRFWNWHYFGGDFFQVIVKVLLKDGHGPYQLFSSFKKYINNCEQKLDKIEDEKSKERYWNYITGLFASFCPTFFNEIDKSPSNHSIWDHDFPQEWKIVPNNSNNKIPRVVLHEFIQWSRDRVFKDDDSKDFDTDLTEVISGIFPSVHSSLFTAFLTLFFSGEVKYVFERKPNFYIFGPSVSWSGSIEETDEDRDRRLSEMMRDKDASQKNDTIQIILKFFHFWQALTIYKDNLTEDESKNWTNLSEDQRLVIVKRVRKEKLEKIKTELESDEVNEICKDSETKQARKNSLLELIKLLDSSL